MDVDLEVLEGGVVGYQQYGQWFVVGQFEVFVYFKVEQWVVGQWQQFGEYCQFLVVFDFFIGVQLFWFQFVVGQYWGVVYVLFFEYIYGGYQGKNGMQGYGKCFGWNY